MNMEMGDIYLQSDRRDIEIIKELLDKAMVPERAWRFSANHKVRGLYADDVDLDGQLEVVVGTDENRLYLLSAVDGEPRWSFHANGWIPTVYSTFVPTDNQTMIVAGSDDGNVYAIDIHGNEIWRFGRPLRMRSVYATDIDGDGATEVLAASFERRLYIFNSKGQLKHNVDVGELIFKLRARDIDGDGKIEIVAATDSGKVLIYKPEDKDLTSVSCSRRIFALELADIDEDGCTEIIAGSFDFFLYVWDGCTMQQKWKRDVGARIYAVLVRDIDHDGKQEILVATTDRILMVLDNHGRDKWYFTLEHWAFDIWMGDIGQDGDLKLVTCSEVDNCVQMYRLPDIGIIIPQIQAAFQRISTTPSLEWEMSREQWRVLSLIISELDVPERVASPGVCDRALRLRGARDLLIAENFREALRYGLELSIHQLDFVWDCNLEANIRDLAIYWGDSDTQEALIFCAPDQTAFLAINCHGSQVLKQEVDFPARRIFVADLFGGTKTIIVGLNSGVHIYDYPGSVGDIYRTNDWIEDMNVEDIDGDGHCEILIASFDGRAYVWDYEMTNKWQYPATRKEGSVYAVHGINHTWNTEARMIIGSFDGSVEALNPAENRLVWKYLCGSRVSVIRSGDFRAQATDAPFYLVIIGSSDGRVHVLDINGVLFYQYYTESEVKWIEVFDINKDGFLELIVGTGDGRLYILNWQGESIGHFQLGDCVQGLQVADIDRDGELEVVFGLRNRKKLFTYRYLQKEKLELFIDEIIHAWQRETNFEDILKILLSDSDSLLRAYGVQIWLRRQLSQIGKEDLQNILNDRSEDVRVVLVWELPRLAREHAGFALSLVERLARDSSWKVQRQLAVHLPILYDAYRQFAERCVELLQGSVHVRVRRNLVRSLVKMLNVASTWSYERLLYMAQREDDEWVSFEIARGLASFVSAHPMQIHALLSLKHCKAIAAIPKFLRRDEVAFHILTLAVDNAPEDFIVSVGELAQFIAREIVQVSMIEPTRSSGEIVAAVLPNVSSIFAGVRVPDDMALPVLFLRRKSVLSKDLGDIRQMFGRHSVGLLVLFDILATQQVHYLLDLLRSYGINVALLTYMEFLQLISSQHAQHLLRSVILRQIDLLKVSPFNVNGPVPADVFFGREQQIHEIIDHAKDTTYAITGGRRYGKSSLLIRLHRDILPSLALRSIYLDCSTTLTYDAFLTVTVAERSQGGYGVRQATFEELLQSLPVDQPLVMLLDEVDRLVLNDRATGWRLFYHLRALVNSGRAQVILCGERTLRDALQDPAGPLFNFANEMPLGPLDFRAVEALVIQPMRQLEIELVDESATVQRIYDVTSGHPNVVQRLCRRLVGRLNERLFEQMKGQTTRQITLDDVDAVINDPQFQEEDFLNTYWDRATPLEKIITLLMAGEAKVYRLIAVMNLLAAQDLRPPPDVAKAALDRLVSLRAILKRSQQGYEFAVKAFPRVLANTTIAEDQLLVLKSEYGKNPMESV
jgi:outer membrane protein assembly factor BamB